MDTTTATFGAIRGATQAEGEDRGSVLAATEELLREVLARNGLTGAQLVSVLFTATPDLTSAFPAEAARRLGLTDVPLLCACEIGVPDAMPRVIRLLAHVQWDRPRSALRHVYLHGAARLRPDLPRPVP
ncbi:chorismate mutase [Micromonospora sp. NPDC051543]|uniref:chorismate mutase n=1 Tax=Micromonospora sp. NPDC051543 TaxID=3364287 RepID=UPI00378D966A